MELTWEKVMLKGCSVTCFREELYVIGEKVLGVMSKYTIQFMINGD